MRKLELTYRITFQRGLPQPLTMYYSCCVVSSRFGVCSLLDAAAINFDLTIENLAKKGIAIDFVASSIAPRSWLMAKGTTEVDYSDEMYDHLIASEGNKNIHELDMFFVANVNGATKCVIATTWADAQPQLQEVRTEERNKN